MLAGSPCTSCRVCVANPGFALCQQCYEQRVAAKGTVKQQSPEARVFASIFKADNEALQQYRAAGIFCCLRLPSGRSKSILLMEDHARKMNPLGGKKEGRENVIDTALREFRVPLLPEAAVATPHSLWCVGRDRGQERLGERAPQLPNSVVVRCAPLAFLYSLL